MNTEYRVANLATDDKSSTVGLQRGRDVQSPAEMTISNVSARLRFIYAQMQKKQMQKKKGTIRVAVRSFSDSEVKSYLDDISRAILAEHRAREKAQEQTLEYLNAIKILIQSFRHEKNF